MGLHDNAGLAFVIIAHLMLNVIMCDIFLFQRDLPIFIKKCPYLDFQIFLI